MKKEILIAIGLCVGGMGALSGQTTLTGDHVITGDLSVGNTGTKGNLEVNGETGNSAAPGIKVTGDGGVTFEGDFGEGKFNGPSSGNYFLWFPKKAALRYGVASWRTEGSLGVGSFAGGAHSEAQGDFSSSVGNNSGAGGDYSFSFGNYSMASGDYSFSFGNYSMASGDYSLAIGEGLALSDYSMAIGSETYAEGEYSLAIGKNVYTSSPHSVVIGEISNASGVGSFAMGKYVGVFGDYSAAIGWQLYSSTYASLVIGRNSVVDGYPDEWVETDPLFVVGNGTGNPSDPFEIQNRNALTLRKNGNLELTGKVSMPRQGDILMGEFGNPE